MTTLICNSCEEFQNVQNESKEYELICNSCGTLGGRFLETDPVPNSVRKDFIKIVKSDDFGYIRKSSFLKTNKDKGWAKPSREVIDEFRKLMAFEFAIDDVPSSMASEKEYLRGTRAEYSMPARQSKHDTEARSIGATWHWAFSKQAQDCDNFVKVRSSFKLHYRDSGKEANSGRPDALLRGLEDPSELIPIELKTVSSKNFASGVVQKKWENALDRYIFICDNYGWLTESTGYLVIVDRETGNWTVLERTGYKKVNPEPYLHPEELNIVVPPEGVAKILESRGDEMNPEATKILVEDFLRDLRIR